MATVDHIRSGLIDKILAIKNKEILKALDILITTKVSDSGAGVVELSDDQKVMLKMSEDDIKNGRLVSQEAMDKRNLEWLNEM